MTKKERTEAAIDDLISVGGELHARDLDEVVERYGVDRTAVAKGFLQAGIDDGWLVDEYFSS